MEIGILQQLGLSNREIEIYLTLLRKGELPVADILKETGAHPQLIYRAIEKLEELEAARLREVRQLVPTLRALQSSPEDVVAKVLRGNEAIRSLRVRAIE